MLLQEKKDLQSEICKLLSQLGGTANYTGYYQAAYAVQLSVEDHRHLLRVTKTLYPEVAARFGTTPSAVERNIRTMISAIWANGPQKLEELTGSPISEKPSPGKFLSMLTAIIENSENV